MGKKSLSFMSNKGHSLGTSPSSSPKFAVKETQRRIDLQKYYSTNPEISLDTTSNGPNIANGVQTQFPSLKELNEKALHNQMSITNAAWPRRFALLLTCFSASVGLGNVWRFPKVAVEHGGGVFLIAYVIVIMAVAQPIHFLELSLGQFSSKGPLKVWKCFPLFRGLGYSQLLITFYLVLNLSLVLSWSVFYLSESFRERLSWAVFANRDPRNYSLVNASLTEEFPNSTQALLDTNMTSQDSRLELSLNFWRKCVVGDVTPEIAGVTTINWKVSLYLLGVMVLVFLCLLPGIKSLRKMTYVTCVPPFIGLTAMTIYLLVSKGSSEYTENLLRLLNPDWEYLKDVRVWYAACQQAFISLNLAFGQLILFSSFNEFEHSVLRDSFIICAFDTVASILSSFAVFAVIGNSETERLINEAGFGLSFVAYSKGIGKIKKLPQLWNFLFFVMIFFLGLGNVVSLMTSLLYAFKQNQRLWKRRLWISLALCLTCYLIGLVFTTDVSLDLLTSLDTYGISFCVILLAILETIGITWGYGIKRFAEDLKFMFKSPLSFYWKANWTVFSPICLTSILLYVHVLRGLSWTPEKGTWPFFLGWGSAIIVVVCIPVGIVYSYMKTDQYGFRNKLRAACHADTFWGPNDPIDLRNWMKNNDTLKSASSSKKSTPQPKTKFKIHLHDEPRTSTSGSPQQIKNATHKVSELHDRNNNSRSEQLSSVPESSTFINRAFEADPP